MLSPATFQPGRFATWSASSSAAQARRTVAAVHGRKRVQGGGKRRVAQSGHGLNP